MKKIYCKKYLPMHDSKSIRFATLCVSSTSARINLFCNKVIIIIFVNTKKLNDIFSNKKNFNLIFNFFLCGTSGVIYIYIIVFNPCNL